MKIAPEAMMFAAVLLLVAFTGLADSMTESSSDDGHEKTMTLTSGEAETPEEEAAAEEEADEWQKQWDEKMRKLAEGAELQVSIEVKEPDDDWGVDWQNPRMCFVKGVVLYLFYQEQRKINPHQEIPECGNAELYHLRGQLRLGGRAEFKKLYGEKGLERMDQLLHDSDWSVVRFLRIASEPLATVEGWDYLKLDQAMAIERNRQAYEMLYGKEALLRADEAVRAKDYSSVWVKEGEYAAIEELSYLVGGPPLTPEQITKIREKVEAFTAVGLRVYEAYQACKNKPGDAAAIQELFAAALAGNRDIVDASRGNSMQTLMGLWGWTKQCLLTREQRRYILKQKLKDGRRSTTGISGGEMSGLVSMGEGKVNAQLEFTGMNAGKVLWELTKIADKHFGELVICTMDRRLVKTAIHGQMQFDKVEDALQQLADAAGGKLIKGADGFQIASKDPAPPPPPPDLKAAVASIEQLIAKTLELFEQDQFVAGLEFLTGDSFKGWEEEILAQIVDDAKNRIMPALRAAKGQMPKFMDYGETAVYKINSDQVRPQMNVIMLNGMGYVTIPQQEYLIFHVRDGKWVNHCLGPAPQDNIPIPEDAYDTDAK